MELRKGLWRDSSGRVRDPFGRFCAPDYVEQTPGEEFRVMVFDEPRGPWRASRHEAMRDAIRAGLASWDQERREHYLAVPVEIRSRPSETAR
ncbi:MAG: hypothetical protein K2X76_15290 [Sphingomonas sp.]|nr:hypothetical protein [Sphingomonas sp.]